MVVYVVFTSSMTTAFIIMWPGTIMCDEVLQVYKTFANMSCSLYASSTRTTQTTLICGLALNTGDSLGIFPSRILLITLHLQCQKAKILHHLHHALGAAQPSLIPDRSAANSDLTLTKQVPLGFSQKVFGKMTPRWEK